MTPSTPPCPFPRRAKIVCTLGPTSTSETVLAGLIRAGMNVARFNFSHGTYAEHGARLATLRRVAAELKTPVGILQDLCGPKIRLGLLPDSGVPIQNGQEVLLSTGALPAPEHSIPVQYDELPRDVHPGDRVLFDDGSLEARVLDVEGANVRVRFSQGGILRSHKGLNLPGVKVSAPSVSAKDLADLEWGLAQGVDFVALSFVRSADDVRVVKERLKHASRPPLVISKIERPEALEHIEEILRLSDGIMVARGDLGVEMDLAGVPLIQKRLIRRANELDKPVITATQMLESMVTAARPTRAEVSDIANAILDGSDALMLSGETAAGAHPAACVATMDEVVRRTEDYIRREDPCPAAPRLVKAENIRGALAFGVERIGRTVGLGAVVAATASGATARYVASSRPAAPILGLTTNLAALGRMTLYWGVIPCLVEDLGQSDDLSACAQELAVSRLGLHAGELLAVVLDEAVTASGLKHAVQLYRIGGDDPAPAEEA